MSSDPDLIEQALAHGAAGFILKGTRLDVLVRGIRAVAAGNVFIDPSLCDDRA